MTHKHLWYSRLAQAEELSLALFCQSQIVPEKPVTIDNWTALSTIHKLANACDGMEAQLTAIKEQIVRLGLTDMLQQDIEDHRPTLTVTAAPDWSYGAHINLFAQAEVSDDS